MLVDARCNVKNLEENLASQAMAILPKPKVKRPTNGATAKIRLAHVKLPEQAAAVHISRHGTTLA